MNELSTTSMIKQMNIELIKTTLKFMKTATKTELARATELSVMTCGKILNELLKTGEVIELKFDPSSGGRPAIRYQYNADYAQVLCLYARTEGTQSFLSYQVCNLLGECLEERMINFIDITYETYEKTIGDVLLHYPRIKMISVGVQGVVNQGVIGTCDIKTLEGIHIEDKLKKRYGLDVIAQNDMNLITYGYYQKQEDEHNQNIAYLYIPKDNYIGSGIIVRGQVVKGETNFAGELSFLPLGVSRSDQIEQFNQTQTMIVLAAKSIASIITVINPALIAISGQCVKEDDLPLIYEELATMIPKEHVPAIVYQADIHEDYMDGLKALAFEKISYELKVVKKTFD